MWKFVPGRGSGCWLCVIAVVVGMAISACTDSESSASNEATSSSSATTTSTALQRTVSAPATSTTLGPVDVSQCQVEQTADDSTTWEVLSQGCGLAIGSAPMTWTGKEVVIWGGEVQSETEWTNSGGAYDPTAGTWRSLATSPLPPMSGHAMVMVDTKIFVCCGRNETGGQPMAALYDPDGDEWTELASPPPGNLAASAIWTGQEVVVPLRSAKYDPSTDRWSSIKRPPTTILPGAEVIWTGEKLLVWSSNHSNDDFLLYDPATDEWTELPQQPSGARAWYGSMIWTGTEVIIWGDQINGNGQSIGWKMNLDQPVWEPIAQAPGRAASWWEGTPGSNAAVWTGDRMLVWAGELLESEQESIVMLSYDPATDSWAQLDSAPVRWYGPTILWTGSQLIVGTNPMTSLSPTS